jgi:hypothetical protein
LALIAPEMNIYRVKAVLAGRRVGFCTGCSVVKATEPHCLTDAAPNEPQGRLADGPAGDWDLQFALTESQDFRVTTTPAACGTGLVARGALAMDLNSAVHKYPTCSSTAKTTAAETVRSRVWPCAIEIAASETDPTKRIGTSTRNRNQIPRTNPISVLKIASVVTPPTPYNECVSLMPAVLKWA